MSDYDPFDGKDAPMVSTMEEFAKAVKDRMITVRKPVTSKAVSGVHMGIFDGLIEVAQLDIRRQVWRIRWDMVGDVYQYNMVIPDHFQLPRSHAINTEHFLRNFRAHALQKIRRDAVIWQQDISNRSNAEGQAMAQSGADFLKVAKGKVPPYQFSDNMRLAMSQQEAFVSAMTDAMLTGTGIARMYSDQIGEPRSVVLNPEHICRLSTHEPETDGTQPVPRKAETIEPVLLAKRIKDW